MNRQHQPSVMQVLAKFTISTLLVVASAAVPVTAQTSAPANSAGSGTSASFDSESIRSYMENKVQSGAPHSGPLQKVDIKLGALDSRVQLAACAQIEPYVPSGARPWGRTVVGVRCVSGASWNMLMPVTVSIWGSVLVATALVSAGTPVDASSFSLQEVEWTRESAPPIFDSADLDGRTLVRSMQPGQILRADMLRATPVVSSGDTVTVRISGSGFSISAQGQALSAAGNGQTVRIRTEQGRMLSGIARTGKTVDVSL